MINVEEIQSVYSGRANRCCCGCSGKHTYASKHRQAASSARGYAIADDEVSDRTVKLIVNKMNSMAGVEKDVGFYSVRRGDRVYVAYAVADSSVKLETQAAEEKQPTPIFGW